MSEENSIKPLMLYRKIVSFEEHLNKIVEDDSFIQLKYRINEIKNEFASLHEQAIYDSDISPCKQMNVFPSYDKDNDFYAKMTEETVKELWNNDKYTREGLKNIALLLLHWVNNE